MNASENDSAYLSFEKHDAWCLTYPFNNRFNYEV